MFLIYIVSLLRVLQVSPGLDSDQGSVFRVKGGLWSSWSYSLHFIWPHYQGFLSECFLFLCLDLRDLILRAGRWLTSGVAGLLDFAGAVQQHVVDHKEVLSVTLDVKLLRCNTDTPGQVTSRTHLATVWRVYCVNVQDLLWRQILLSWNDSTDKGTK